MVPGEHLPADAVLCGAMPEDGAGENVGGAGGSWIKRFRRPRRARRRGWLRTLVVSYRGGLVPGAGERRRGVELAHPASTFNRW